MIIKKKYKDLRETMSYMKTQIIESIPYAESVLPEYVGCPRSLWEWLRPQLNYVPDPPGTELLQTMQTLMSGDRTGVQGGGDCDCFVITCTACCNALKIPVDIVLVGRSKKAPVHIYNRVTDKQGNIYVMDFTEPLYGMERYYPYFQNIQANL